MFRLCYQKEGESIDSYLTRLRSLAKTCEFHDVNEELVDQVIEKCHSNKLRKRLLREPGLNINKVIDIAQASEVASRQVLQYQDIHTTKTPASQQSSDEELPIHNITLKGKYPKKSGISQSHSNTKVCYRCGNNTMQINVK